MSAPVDVCVVGSANLDLVARVPRLPAPGETVLGGVYQEHPGGKGLNQAVAAARAGGRVAMLGALGTDSAGDVLAAVLTADGIDAGRVLRLDVPTGRALIGVAETGENAIIVAPGANAQVTVGSLPPCRVLLVQLEVPLPAVATAVTLARAAGALTVVNPAPAASLATDVLQHCDVMVPNQHEEALLGGADALLAAGVRVVVSTLGSRGALVRTRRDERQIEPWPVQPVDTTGAGDTFCGVLAVELARAVAAHGSSNAVDLDTVAAAASRAAAAAALSTTRAGAVPSIPSAAEVDRFVATSAG
jgi:ribokinase